MRRPWLFVVCAACLSSLAFASIEGDEMERNRRLLEKWKTDPEHYRRLKRDLAAFYALPAERQAQIRDLDEQLHEYDPDTQSRLWAVMERYSVWLEQLPEPERRAVLEAKDKATVIRYLRQREWIERLPRAIREELAGLPRDRRLARIKELQAQQQQQRVLWTRPPGTDGVGARPARYKDLPTETQKFIDKELMPRLSDGEKLNLKKAEGKWPEYPKQLDSLAATHPILPEGPKGKIIYAKQLPSDVKSRLDRSWSAKRVANLEGRWPDYALAVCDTLRIEQRYVVPPLGACRPDELPPQTRNFVKNQLVPKLNSGERSSLARWEGSWPDYPRGLLMLARKHQLVIPGMSLPGPTYAWDEARVARPEQSAQNKRATEAAVHDFGGGKLNFGEIIKRLDSGKKPQQKPPQMRIQPGRMGRHRD